MQDGVGKMALGGVACRTAEYTMALGMMAFSGMRLGGTSGRTAGM